VYVIFCYKTAQTPSAQSRIFILFVQMAMLFFGTDTAWLSWMSFIDMNPFAAGNGSCVAPIRPLTRLLLGLLLPFCCMMLLWLTYVLRRVVLNSLRPATARVSTLKADTTLSFAADVNLVLSVTSPSPCGKMCHIDAAFNVVYASDLVDRHIRASMVFIIFSYKVLLLLFDVKFLDVFVSNSCLFSRSYSPSLTQHSSFWTAFL